MTGANLEQRLVSTKLGLAQSQGTSDTESTSKSPQLMGGPLGAGQESRDL
jgi:hypothetical protein